VVKLGISVSAEMVLNTEAERNYIFNHMWRQTAKKFYDPKLHGVDWKMYKDTYAKFYHTSITTMIFKNY
jgi:C-terminal processing protease CtpA/Prc